MKGDFGKFIETKRKSKRLTLRGLASALEIAPAFMSDIEKGHRYPPQKDKLQKMAEILSLNEDDTHKMYDLAGSERANMVSPDLPDYIMGHDKVRVALRLARDHGASDKEWQKVIDVLENEQEEAGNQ